MKKNLIVAAIAAASAFAAFAPAAHAADGKIEFTGLVKAQTCVINGGEANNDFTVALPPVATGTLAEAGAWAGRTPFSIKLTECSPDTGEVATYFEPGSTVDQGTGALIVDASDDNSTAKNVQIRLLNNAFAPIKAGAEGAAQNSQIAKIASGKADLNYFAQYESQGEATAGIANSRVHYTMMYQ
ncbi:putative fimbrial protein [Collimonas arenae]|uniref:Putative fimbrial protein n=1 Tax=Collimonas arenae TaxID=279058 RepID=A0A0A1FAT8_9BURK|nr:fimbrial protein [Collimonas arenae]AIY41646.1 putative fimbrial protein [Collimonas arenae]